MFIGIMTTNGGAHPADKWAAQTARTIADLIQIDEHSTSPEAKAARKAKPRFEIAMADVIETLHDNVQKLERSKLEANGDAQLAADPNDGIIDTVPEAVAAIVKAAQSTPFAAHFNLPQVQDVITATVEQHFGISIDIERSWHADRNPDSAVAKAYKDARPEHGRRAHLHAAQALAQGGKGKAKG